MDMIGHQTVRMDRIVVFAPIPAQSLYVDAVILIAEKGPLSLVSSDNDVVEKTGRKQPWTTGHTGIS
jgi:hypothetical protein